LQNRPNPPKKGAWVPAVAVCPNQAGGFCGSHNSLVPKFTAVPLGGLRYYCTRTTAHSSAKIIMVVRCEFSNIPLAVWRRNIHSP
jgi:hypothetical protein